MHGAIDVAEQSIQAVSKEILERHSDELEFFKKSRDVDTFGRLENLIRASFPRISYTEAVDILSRYGERIQWGESLSTENERFLANHFNGYGNFSSL